MDLILQLSLESNEKMEDEFIDVIISQHESEFGYNNEFILELFLKHHMDADLWETCKIYLNKKTISYEERPLFDNYTILDRYDDSFGKHIYLGPSIRIKDKELGIKLSGKINKYCDARLANLVRERGEDKPSDYLKKGLFVGRIPKKYSMSLPFIVRLSYDPISASEILSECKEIMNGNLLKKDASYFTQRYLNSNLSIDDFSKKIIEEINEYL